MSLNALLYSLATIQSFSTSINAIGEVTVSYTTGTSYKCRKTAVLIAGENRQANRIVDVNRDKFFFLPSTPVTETGRIQLLGQSYNVLRVDKFPGGQGTIHHLEVITERMV